MIDPNELERLSKAAEKTEDDIRYYSGGSKYNEPLEQLKDRLVHLYRTGQLVPVQQPSGDVVEDEAETCAESNLWDKTPGCDGIVVSGHGGGIRCSECSGWFCF